MGLDIESYLNTKKELINMHLPLYFKKLTTSEKLKEAMLYSLNAGGKRLRPILLLSTLKAFEKDEQIGIDVACALEMIHTYSLIHDDLPAMDNDDLRRGKPTNHKVFGDAVAILAGDGLLTYSFECISNIDIPTVNDSLKLELIRLLANAAGAEGMVAGQADDLEAEGIDITLDQLESIHARKTGRLLTFAVEAGAILAEATSIQREILVNFANHLGLAFQIQDDILDIEGDEKTVGKPIGSDMTNNKNTYPRLLSIEGAKEKLTYHVNQAKNELLKTGLDTRYLEAITDYMLRRNH